MGFFSFLKREKKEVKEIKLGDVNEFISSWQKRLIEDINLELESINKKLDDEKAKISDNISKLENAELNNKNIPERAKQMMEGNRETYIKKVNVFAKGIKLPDDLNEVLGYCDTFNASLDDFSKSTLRNYHILLEFFRDHVVNISVSMKNLDILMKNLKKIVEDSEIEKIGKLKDKNDEIKGKINWVKESKLKIEDLKKNLKIKNNDFKEKEGKLRKLEESEDYEGFLDFVSEKDIIEDKINIMEKELFNYFFDIKTALKKYERLSIDDKLVRKYIEDSLNALLGDDELKIVEIIVKMKESILKGDLELKEDKKNRMLKELDKGRDYFESFLKKYNGLNEKIGVLKNDIDSLKIVDEINELKKELKIDKVKLEKDEYNVKKISDDIDNFDVNELKKELEKSFLDVGEEVKII
ncbi:MAG: hypothetical protein KJ674_04945 [Nanoarchaeota archaeon]|nr:hypothetical protein [Nanoarchaeota archaeon]